MGWRATFLALAVMALGVVPALAGDINVPLIVRDNSGVQRQAWPVSGGIPMPVGALKDCSTLRVVDEKGKPIPAQFDPFVRWWGRDGSVKWVLVDFQADVPANGEGRYSLVSGPVPEGAATTLKVTETDKAIEVITGPLKAVISKERGTLIEEAYLDADGDGKFAESERFIKPDPYNGSVLVSAEQEVVHGQAGMFNPFGNNLSVGKCEPKGGKLIEHRYGSGLGKPDKVVVESQGPVRVTVRVEGRHWPSKQGEGIRKDGFYFYTAWISFYAGKPFFHIVHSIDNERAANWPACQFQIKDAAVGFALDSWAAKDAKFTFGGEKEDSAGVLPAGGPCVLKDTDDGGRHPGWADLSAGGRGLTVELKNFWEEGPKAFRLSAGRSEAVLMPDYATSVLFQLNVATRQSHEMTWFPHRGDAAAAQSRALAEGFRYPLIPWAGGEWYANANVWPEQTSAPPKAATSNAHWVPKAADWRNQGRYDNFNPGGMHDNYWSVFYRFLQAGDLNAFETALVRAKWASESLPLLVHDYSFSRKDAVPEDALVGWGPKELFTSRKAAEAKGADTPYYVSGGGPKMNGEHLRHVWPFEWDYLTGSPIAREAVRSIGNIAAYSTHKNFFKSKSVAPELTESSWFDDQKFPDRRPSYFYTRIYASHLFCCATAYSATGDPELLYYARWLARRLLYLQRLTGGTIEEEKGWKDLSVWQDSESSIAAFELYRDTGDKEWLDIMGSWIEFTRKEAWVPGQGVPHRWLRGTVPTAFDRHWYPAVAAPEIYVALGDPWALEFTKFCLGTGLHATTPCKFPMSATARCFVYAATHTRKDSDPPEAVTDLKVVSAGKDGVKLTWTAPKDAGEGSTGSAARYWIKYADKPIVDQPKFPEEVGKKYGFYHADNVRGEATPTAAGQKEAFTVQEIVPHAAYGSDKKMTVADLPLGKYWFALKSWDAAGNISKLSNVAEVEIK